MRCFGNCPTPAREYIRPGKQRQQTQQLNARSHFSHHASPSLLMISAIGSAKRTAEAVSPRNRAKTALRGFFGCGALWNLLPKKLWVCNLWSTQRYDQKHLRIVLCGGKQPRRAVRGSLEMACKNIHTHTYSSTFSHRHTRGNSAISLGSCRASSRGEMKHLYPFTFRLTNTNTPFQPPSPPFLSLAL